MSFTRYAIYYVPPEGAFAAFGAAWLGWDVAAGRACRPLDIDGLDDATVTPRKYGFHGTLKPPFRLAEGQTPGALQEAVAAMAGACGPAECEGLGLTRLGRFLALTPQGDTGGIARIAATCVADLDAFRAPPSEAELDRRRKAGLSAAQEALLVRWGYPYVMEEFRFHLTLTGRLPKGEIDAWMDTARAHLPDLPRPFEIREVALVGERADGRFELVQRYALTG